MATNRDKIDTQEQDAPDAPVAAQKDDFAAMADSQDDFTDETSDVDESEVSDTDPNENLSDKDKPEGEGDGETPPAETPEGDPKAPAKEPAPAEEPPAEKPTEPEVEKPEEVKPESQPVQEPEPPVPQPPVVEPLPQQTPEEREAANKEWRRNAEETLASHHYNLSEEQIQEFEDSPGTAIPKLMSRLYLDTLQGAVQLMAKNLAPLMQDVNDRVDAGRKNEEEFFKEWPELDSVKDGGTVHTLATMFRTAYPSATKQQFFKTVGAQALVALGRAPGAERIPPAKAPESTPFTPAQPAAPRGGSPVKPTNPFAILADEFEEEDASDF